MLEEAVVLGRQHRVDQYPRYLIEPDRPMVLAGAVRRARQHFGLEREIGDLLAGPRDALDALVDHVEMNGLRLAATLPDLERKELPVASHAPELSR